MLYQLFSAAGWGWYYATLAALIIGTAYAAFWAARDWEREQSERIADRRQAAREGGAQ